MNDQERLAQAEVAYRDALAAFVEAQKRMEMAKRQYEAWYAIVNPSPITVVKRNVNRTRWVLEMVQAKPGITTQELTNLAKEELDRISAGFPFNELTRLRTQNFIERIERQYFPIPQKKGGND